MLTRLQRAVEGFLAALILLLLHSLHGTTLLIALFVHLSHHLKQAYASAGSSTDDAEREKKNDGKITSPCKIPESDKAIWQARKIPKCLAVVFVPAARGHFSLSRFRYVPWDEKDVYTGMAQDVGNIGMWAKELGMENLLLYDENGLLKKYSTSLQDAIQQQQRQYTSIESTATSESIFSIPQKLPSSTKSFSISDNTFVHEGLRITLLARGDGKEHVATVTKGISKGIQAGFIEQDEVDVDFVQEKLYSSLCPEPDLLIVLGGLHLRLRGFPPWHTRLCEIYHDSSLSLLGPPRLRYAAFRRAMDNYAGCEQRLGR